MFSIAFWNIRGLNHAPKQSEVQQVVYGNNLSVCGILESHVDLVALSNVVSKVFRNWDWASNASVCTKGCRIIIGWNKDVVDVVIESFLDQAIHTKIIHKADQKFFFCTFIYAGNDPKVRRVLWSNLSYHKVMVHNQPWILLGDFNVALNVEDSLSGSSSMMSAMCDFKDCVEDIEVMDISSSGLQYTWTQKPKAVVKFPNIVASKPKPFKMYNFLTYKPRMKLLKKLIRKLLNGQGNIHERVANLRVKLDAIQMDLDTDPLNEVSKGSCTSMIRSISNDEIKRAMFDIGDDKARGPNGFTSVFLKKAWDTVGIINDIEQLMRGFLWCNGDLKKGKAKVAWRDICLPKNKGGLGLRSLKIFNLALMTTHIWSIASNRESLWVRWIHTYKLCGRTIWDVQPRSEMSWGWRKLLKLREYVKPFFWSDIGNGKSTSLWYDRWCSLSPLSNLLSPRDIHREGYFLNTCVADIITNRSWNWPLRWLAKAPDIANISVPVLSDQKDCILWRDLHGKSCEFSVRNAWEMLRAREDVCSWHNVVWFTHGIPRHSFHLWIVMRRSLKTQGMLHPWDVGPATDLSSLRCPLCNNQQDSHEHLFFECAYAAKVWGYVRDLADLNDAPPVCFNGYC
nr:hypothetical protein [Tanacetum cinerariifolium]